MWIDLRSDTVTLQPAEMVKEMTKAVVGDDVYGDDPTARALEALAAKMLGKEAGLFVPSGTFGNQVAILTHTHRGDEVIIGSEAHILMHEVGAAAVISGVQLRTIALVDNQMDVALVERTIRQEDIHYPDTGLICLENALGNGAVMPLKNMQEIYQLAQERKIPVHLDGARIFNGALALGVSAKELADCADTVNICLSKGLCAPVGSVLVGSKAFIDRARKNRKLMGGGMRQVGFLAAAGLYALEHMTGRLKEDHENLQYLANALEKMEGITIKKDRTAINMLFFELPESIIKESDFLEKLLLAGIKSNGMEDGEYRFVTHYGVDRHQIDQVIDTVQKILMEV
jgi:threonine aldolase